MKQIRIILSGFRRSRSVAHLIHVSQLGSAAGVTDKFVTVNKPPASLSLATRVGQG